MAEATVAVLEQPPAATASVGADEALVLCESCGDLHRPEATTTCDTCGEAVCRYCKRTVNGEPICKRCVHDLHLLTDDEAAVWASPAHIAAEERTDMRREGWR